MILLFHEKKKKKFFQVKGEKIHYFGCFGLEHHRKNVVLLLHGKAFQGFLFFCSFQKTTFFISSFFLAETWKKLKTIDILAKKGIRAIAVVCFRIFLFFKKTIL